MLSRFDLRTRLTLGFAALVFIVLVAYGTSLLARLGPAIDRIMHENHRSVVAMQEIQDALERMDSGAARWLNVLLEWADSEEEIVEEVRIFLHEIGHFFGRDEDKLDELGYA